MSRLRALIGALCAAAVAGFASAPAAHAVQDVPTSPGSDGVRGLTGRYVLLQAESDHASMSVPALVSGNVTYRLRGDSTAYPFRPGQLVEASGTVTGHTMTADTVTAAGPVAATPSSLNVLVELVTWTAPDDVTPAQATRQYAVTDRAWYADASYGAMSVTGTSTNWMRIPAPADPDGTGPRTACDNTDAIASAGDAAAVAAGVNPSDYTNVAYYYPLCSGEQWGGWGQVGGNRTWLIGEMSTRVSVHELGHNLGLRHSHSDTCTLGGATVAYSTTCSIDEYGDPVSAMGGGYLGQGMYAASQQAALGWLGTGTHGIRTVSAAGTYALAPYESRAGGTQALKIANSAGREFWVEYRQPVGVDAFLGAGLTHGVLIRSAEDTFSHLYDMTPARGGFTDAALPVGRTWSDPTSNLSVSVASATPTGATVAVAFGAPPARKYEETAAALGGWTAHRDRLGSYRASTVAGDAATFAFSGRSITWHTRKGPAQGHAQVLIDGVNKGTVDLYAAAGQPASVSFARLARRPHTIVVKALGTKSAAASAANVAVDSFTVGRTTTQENSTRIRYDMWRGVGASGASGRSYRSSAVAGQTASLSFTGTRVDWVATTGPGWGKAEVYVDGVDKGTVDLYAAVRHFQTVKPFSGLAAGHHTITVKVLGTKNPAAAATTVNVDAFVVH